MAKEKELTILLPGFPEIEIARLVRRSHNAENCPHKGNCLSEREMISQLHELLANLIISAQNY